MGRGGEREEKREKLLATLWRPPEGPLDFEDLSEHMLGNYQSLGKNRQRELGRTVRTGNILRAHPSEWKGFIRHVALRG